jgi:membrane protein
MQKYINLLKTTFQEWNDDNVPRLAASLAYYTAFSLAPLLVIVISIIGFFFGEQAAQGQIVSQLGDELGTDIAAFVQQMIQNADEPSQGIFSSVISVVMLMVGATGVFMQLQSALNEIWEIEVEGGFGKMLKKRLSSFGMVMTLAFLLLVSLVISSFIASLDTFLTGILPGVQLLIHVITTLLSFGVSALLFGIIYKYMPDAQIEWGDVAVGAVVTALLFNIGRVALGFYLGNVGTASTYGAAGSFVVILLWVYYSTQILMFGAEFTQVYAREYGTRIRPEEDASFEAGHRRKITDKKPALASVQQQPAPVRMPSTAPVKIPSAPDQTRAQDSPSTKVVHTSREEPNHTIIVSTFMTVIGMMVGWILHGRD